jgi:GT2 family glycosyltransferase
VLGDGSDAELQRVPELTAASVAMDALVTTVPSAGASLGAAVNAGVRASAGEFVIVIAGARPVGARWIGTLIDALVETGAGLVGPRVVIDGGAGEACGMLVCAAPRSLTGFTLQTYSGVRARIPCDVLPADCLVMTRATFERAGGFAEDLGSALESIDFCLRVRACGGSVVLEPAATFERFASLPDALPAPEQASRRHAFAERWRERADPHENFWPEFTGTIACTDILQGEIAGYRAPLPSAVAVVHGDAPRDPAAFAARLRRSRMQPAQIVWCAGGAVPAGCIAMPDAIAAVRALSEVRSSNYVALVRTDTELGVDWLNELVNAAERAPHAAAATASAMDVMARTADARCTLVRLRGIPQHLRIEPAPSLDEAVATWLERAVDAGRNIERAPKAAVALGAGDPRSDEPARVILRDAPEAFVSIVMLSWNAVAYTELAIASIRDHTRTPHEIIIVDNGSAIETTDRLHAIPGIRLICNAVNTGFAFACNQGIAAARGTHVVLLNNDVVVADGWLEAMLAVLARAPAVGCAAPRTNRIVGRQQLDVPYTDVADMPAFAAQRAIDERGNWKRETRAVGFCLCVPRHVIDELGGLDPRYGVGNFEDDDFCMRLRAAGYDIAVCEDAFVHHFGSVSFAANAIDYRATIARNVAIFRAHWDIPDAGADIAYDAMLPIRRGFIRERDYVPLPPPSGVGPDWTSPA